MYSQHPGQSAHGRINISANETALLLCIYQLMGNVGSMICDAEGSIFPSSIIILGDLCVQCPYQCFYASPQPRVCVSLDNVQKRKDIQAYKSCTTVEPSIKDPPTSQQWTPFWTSFPFLTSLKRITSRLRTESLFLNFPLFRGSTSTQPSSSQQGICRYLATSIQYTLTSELLEDVFFTRSLVNPSYPENNTKPTS